MIAGYCEVSERWDSPWDQRCRQGVGGDIGPKRLVEAIPDAVTALVAGRTVLRCSPKALKLAEDLDAENEATRAATEAETREALVAGDFRRASSAVALYA